MFEYQTESTGYGLRRGDKFWTKPAIWLDAEWSPITRLVFKRNKVTIHTANGWKKSVVIGDLYPIKRQHTCQCCDKHVAMAPVNIAGEMMRLCCFCAPVMVRAVELNSYRAVEETPVLAGVVDLDAL